MPPPGREGNGACPAPVSPYTFGSPKTILAAVALATPAQVRQASAGVGRAGQQRLVAQGALLPLWLYQPRSAHP